MREERLGIRDMEEDLYGGAVTFGRGREFIGKRVLLGNKRPRMGSCLAAANNKRKILEGRSAVVL